MDLILEFIIHLLDERPNFSKSSVSYLLSMFLIFKMNCSSYLVFIPLI
uniref:Uncharacterized protein n=1 Tax=Lepeophtheirus salmonis TaxID=72036 RepID=A0A0K2UVZ3_LEPSM